LASGLRARPDGVSQNADALDLDALDEGSAPERERDQSSSWTIGGSRVTLQLTVFVLGIVPLGGRRTLCAGCA